MWTYSKLRLVKDKYLIIMNKEHWLLITMHCNHFINFNLKTSCLITSQLHPNSAQNAPFWSNGSKKNAPGETPGLPSGRVGTPPSPRTALWAVHWTPPPPSSSRSWLRPCFWRWKRCIWRLKQTVSRIQRISFIVSEKVCPKKTRHFVKIMAWKRFLWKVASLAIGLFHLYYKYLYVSLQ